MAYSVLARAQPPLPVRQNPETAHKATPDNRLTYALPDVPSIPKDMPSRLHTCLRPLLKLESQTLFWSEAMLFKKIMFRFTNAHKRAVYFQAALQMRRLFKRLEECNLQRVVLLLQSVLGNGSKHSASVPSHYLLLLTHFTLAQYLLLLDQLSEVAEKAYVSFGQTVREGFYVSLCITMMGCCSRLRRIALQWKSTLGQVYDDLYLCLKDYQRQ
ncbi:hypothetical protein H4R34_000280 [Dimargaris verticillata]|uniref:Nucleolus and neural progenitor protein-like N-terminal domain-containing protein n=1 Tax=Dimargaris verticillata TaxID=2761393 RepID=A0A9W8B6J0_9FUNG|nr:hypothetical protein H4R34_000280 [Dimargaris verticillata]